MASTQSTNQLTTVQPSIHMRSAAKMQRPSTASQALKLLKKRHPKLLKRRSSSITSNGSLQTRSVSMRHRCYVDVISRGGVQTLRT